MKELPLIRPIKPIERQSFPTDRGWIYELKYDGFRGILYAQGGKAWFLTKNGKRHPAFSDLEAMLTERLKDAEVILEGEVCYMDKDGHPVRRGIQSNKGSLALIAFDILWLDGRDLRDLPLKQRKKILARFVKEEMRPGIQVASFIEGSGIELFKLAYERGLEGIMAKRRDDPYSSLTQWFKIKNPHYVPAPLLKPASRRP